MSVLQKITGTVYQTFDGEYLVKIAENLYVDMEGRLTIDLQRALNNLSSGEWIEQVESEQDSEPVAVTITFKNRKQAIDAFDQMGMKSIVAALQKAEVGGARRTGRGEQ